jgi:hypothetical protein
MCSSDGEEYPLAVVRAVNAMGIAYAARRASKRGLYWVQLLADPRA